MSRHRLALLLLLGAIMVACSSEPHGAIDDGGTGNGSGVDSGPAAPPFTRGVSTLAGAADPGDVDGDRNLARFHNPVGVALGPDGNVYVADFDNGKVRVVTADGTTSTLISQDNFIRPFAVAFAPDGTLYAVTDNDATGKGHGPMSGTVWKIDVGTHTATVVADAIGRPRGIVVLSDGRLALADYQHHVIELLDPGSGTLTTLAGAWDKQGDTDGRGSAARFSTPYGLVQAADGKLIVCDYDNHQVRVVALDGAVTTLAGGGVGFHDGPSASAQFDHPEAIAIAANGDLYVTDTDNFRVRRISNGNVETIAGDGNPGYMDSDSPLAAELYGLEGVAAKSDGSIVYVADGTRGDDVPYNRVREVDIGN